VTTIELVYWDSDAFLGWLQEETGKVNLCEGTIERAKAGEVVIVTSTLTLAEVLWMRGGPRVPEEKADKVRRFFRHSYLRLWTVTRSIAEDAQDLVWKHSIRPKDAIHVATALAARCPTLETFDEGLLKQSGTVGAPPLIIRRPIPPRQGRLNLGST
jgi:predicted nucleic acid-binding protein